MIQEHKLPLATRHQVLAGSMFIGLKAAGMLRINEAVESLGAQPHHTNQPQPQPHSSPSSWLSYDTYSSEPVALAL